MDPLLYKFAVVSWSNCKRIQNILDISLYFKKNRFISSWFAVSRKTSILHLCDVVFYENISIYQFINGLESKVYWFVTVFFYFYDYHHKFRWNKCIHPELRGGSERCIGNWVMQLSPYWVRNCSSVACWAQLIGWSLLTIKIIGKHLYVDKQTLHGKLFTKQRYNYKRMC